jgi:ABC-type lipoprotein export system ATPase subunit
MEKDDSKAIANFNYYRVKLWNPIKKHTEFKTFNMAKFTVEEVKEKAKEWKELKKKEYASALQEMEENIKVKRDNLDLELDDKYGLSILMIGSTRSGKSTCLNYLMDKYFFAKENKYINVIFSNSYQADTYDNFKKSKNTTGSMIYQPDIIKDLYKINSQTSNKYKFNVILDDVVDQKNDKELKKMLTIYRNSRIGTIICLQNDKLMNATTRGNINHVLLFKLNSDEAIEKVIKMYLLSFFPRHYKMVDRIKKYKELTSDHSFFWLNNLEGTIKLCKIKL